MVPEGFAYVTNMGKKGGALTFERTELWVKCENDTEKSGPGECRGARREMAKGYLLSAFKYQCQGGGGKLAKGTIAEHGVETE